MTGQFIAHTPNIAADFAWRRWVKVLPLSCAATLGLMVLMERLIATAPVELPPLVPYVVPDIVMPETPVVIVRDTMPVKPEAVLPEPVLPPPSIDFTADTPQISPVLPVAKIDPPSLTTYSSATPVPTVMVQAAYPHRALSRGIEGYVDVAFDVTETGATTNVRVISAHPENVFDRAAVRAVQNWKFAPVVVDGTPQPYMGLRRRVVFELEKG